MVIFKYAALFHCTRQTLNLILCSQVYEETLTYLNQGQSYEIRLKKLGDVPELNFVTLVKSQLRVVFHDRRLQYTEMQQFQVWKSNRPAGKCVV